MTAPLSADDFVEQPRGSGPLTFWQSRSPIATAFGAFNVELNAAPDPELVALVSELAGFVAENYGDIFEAVYAHYQWACEDRYWMRGCGVPRGLRYDRVARYVLSRTVSVRRGRDGVVTGSIFLLPEWDTEHGIDLAVRDGRLVRGDE